MYEFHITLHARSPLVSAAPIERIDGRDLPTLHVPAEALAEPFAVSFEAAVAALEKLPRMVVEPDGSLVWVSVHGLPAWQLDGVLYDRGGRLLFVDLKGTCTSVCFNELLAALGWPRQAVIVQLARQAVFLDETAFREFAERQSQGS